MRSLWPYPFAVLILTGCQQRFDTDPAAASERPALATISILAWNIESGGNDPAEISYQLSELSGYDIYAFSEVDDDNVMLYASSCGPHFSYVVSFSGRRDRLLTLFDAERFELLKHEELDSYRDIRLNDSNHRSPLVLLLQDRTSGVEFQVVTVHLARGDADLRTEQAKGLREWGRDQTLSTIAIGDFNMDFDFHTERGNEAFPEMLRDNVWTWVRPEKLIDTNWSDPDGDGMDNYPDSMLDFAFVADWAKDWNPVCRVVVREGDFPDDHATSDHRPIELVLRP